MGQIRTAIGLMSGTSMDGIDVALLRTDGEAFVERGPAMGVRYDPAFRKRLQGALETAKAIVRRDERPGDLAAVERELSLRHAEAVREFLSANRLTPADIERIIGLSEGNIFQGELALHQLFFLRPVPAWAKYRTPLKGYWQCGAGTHPGGGIMGASGRLAALQILNATERS